MSYLVKDFSPSFQKWVSWVCTTVANAYLEYPYNSNLFPIVSQLSGRLIVVKKIAEGANGSVVPPSSVWDREGDDLIASYIVDGHTGKWAVEIRRQEIRNSIGVVTDGIDTEVAYDTYLSYKLDDAGNITSETTFDNVVQGFIDENGQVVFKTPREYDAQDVNITLTSDSSLPASFVDIVPSTSDMPDTYWVRSYDELIIV